MQDGGIRSPETRSQVPNLAVEKRSFRKVKFVLKVSAAYANLSQGQRGTTCYGRTGTVGLRLGTLCRQLYLLTGTVIGNRYLVHCPYAVSVTSALSVGR